MMPRLNASGIKAPGIEEERINAQLRDHATGLSDWPLQAAADFFYTWADRLITHFDMQVPVPTIKFAQLNVTCAAQYHIGRDGQGLRYSITINTRHLDMPLSELLDTLAHELLHLWQELHGTPPKPGGRDNYHNVELRSMAESIGLLIDSKGRSQGPTENSPFLALLEANNIPITPGLVFPEAKEKPKGKGSKMQKWSCTCPVNVRCVVNLKATCQVCGDPFLKSEPRTQKKTPYLATRKEWQCK